MIRLTAMNQGLPSSPRVCVGIHRGELKNDMTYRKSISRIRPTSKYGQAHFAAAQSESMQLSCISTSLTQPDRSKQVVGKDAAHLVHDALHGHIT